MITRLPVGEAHATPEFGMACQRLVPWAGAQQGAQEPPFGAMACYLPAGGASDPDCHDQDEVMIVLSGLGDVEIAGERAPATAGEMVVIPRNRQHVVRNPGGETLVWLSLYWPLREPKAGAST
jgi:mannose-6-phosphate isomerase-like protein (cupin superfamily)